MKKTMVEKNYSGQENNDYDVYAITIGKYYEK